MFDSELRNATQLMRKFDTQIKEQCKDKRNKSTRVEKNRQSIAVSKRS